MDEKELEESLVGYKAQLSQILQVLPTADAVTKLELYDLEKDLKDIISVTEESLLTLKKEKLLLLLSEGNDADTSKNDIENRPTQTEGECSKNETTAPIDELDFVGTKCRVKFTQEWGSFQYHNAMVLGYEADEENEESIQVRVLFLNPTHISMVPCKYFLDAKCNYENDCRFSHGFLVDASELQEYEEPDFTGLSVGSKCLAKYDENGVWYKATISDMHDDQVTISFETYDESVTLDFHSIFPIVSSSDPVSSSSEEELSESEQNDAMILTYKPVSMVGPVGDWEEHTRGIGSKLMAKMGYIFGKGLGKDSQGRVELVEIELLPPGKSLDHIAELRKKGFIKDPTKKMKGKKKTTTNQTDQNKGTTTAAFDLINKLTHKSKGANNSSHNTHKVKFGVEDSYKLLKKDLSRQKSGDVRHKQKDNANLNVHMFKNSEKISALKKKLSKQKEALVRNPGNSTVSRTIKMNIELTQNELNELLNIDKSLQDKLRMKHQSKKLSIF